MKLSALLGKRPSTLAQIGIWAGSIVAIGLIGYLRMHSPAVYEFHLLFVLPVLAVAWFIGLRRAAMLSVLAVVLWYLAERQLVGGGLERGPLLFNTLQRLGLMISLAWLLVQFRNFPERR